MRILTWLFFATLSLILLLQLRGLDEPLTLDASPYGIVSYEMAWSAPRAAAIAAAWKTNDAIEAAKVSLGVDFAFLLAYPLFFAASIRLLLRDAGQGAFDRSGRVLHRAVLACIPLDAVENLSLWRMLDHGASETLSHVATLCATVKFLLVMAAILWCVAALARTLSTFTISRST
jgi:hypothetical protein